MDQPSAVCKICHNNKSLYTCPKCQVVYCSLKCYQSPGHQKCSEKFYQDNVLEELQNKNASAEEKQAMIELLKQFEQDCIDDEQVALDDELVNDLTQRLEGVDLDGNPQCIWEKLTKEEREKFIQMVKEEKYEDFVNEWLPWWTYEKKPSQLVAELDDDDGDRGTTHEHSDFTFPDVPTTIKSFSSISKIEPAECVKYNSINIMLAYAYIARRYNGEHQHMSIQCAEDLVSLSDVLLKSDNCHDVPDAVRKVLAALLKVINDDAPYRSPLITALVLAALRLSDKFIAFLHFHLVVSMEYFYTVIDDVTRILHGPEQRITSSFQIMSFCDMLTLVDNARKELRKSSDGDTGRKKLSLIVKKLQYYCSWVKTYGEAQLEPVIAELIVFKEILINEQETDAVTGKLRKKAKDLIKNESNKIQELPPQS